MEGAVIFDVKEEGEREREREQHVALSFDVDNPSRFVTFDLFCRLRFVVLVSVLSFTSIFPFFCRFVESKLFFISSFCYSLFCCFLFPILSFSS